MRIHGSEVYPGTTTSPLKSPYVVSKPTTIQIIAAALFAVAIIHTFSTKFFERLAHSRPAHSGVWHLLAEVEIVFGFWALVMAAVMFSLQGTDAKERGLTEADDAAVIAAMAADPKLIERPIVETEKGVRLCRPQDVVREIL
mgnify:CR=1 FL=1